MDRCTLFLLLFTALPALSTCRSTRIGRLAGPFRVKPDHIEPCPPELQPKIPFILHYHGVRDRHNVDVWYYWANFTHVFTVDDTSMADLNFASWSSRGGWKDNAFVINLPKFCTDLKAMTPTLWKSLMVAVYDNANAFCPFPPATSYMKNMSTDFSVKKMPVFFYGKWRITVRMLRTVDKETLACVRLFGETIPKLNQDKFH